mmetsp:Transcript_62577/g.71880  ORF Transcript_62577/g.71880 Transcript_62577/m.71880 type:complete len:446 (-) Transcript_62577:97-1434(-)
MTPSINLHTNSKNASTKGSKNSITFSPDSKCRFHTTLINNQRITKRLFFPTSHSQSRSERTDEREGCESSEATTTGAGVGDTVVSSTKIITSRYNHCPRNSIILESRPTTNTTHFNINTTISAGIAIATDRSRCSTGSTTPQQQQHCRSVSSSSSNNGCLQQQQQPLFSSADNLVSKEISIKNKRNSASMSDDDDVNEEDVVDVNDLSHLPVLVVNNKNSSNDDNSDNESFISDTDSFDNDDEKMNLNINNKDWRSSSGNSSTTESNYRGVSSYLTPSPRPLNAFRMSSLDGSPFLPQAPQHYAQVTPQYPRQSLQPEIQESYNTQIPLHNDYHTTLQRVCGTTRKEEDDDENDVDDESVDWQGGFYSNNSNENDDDDNNESAPYHFLAARTGSNIHRCMSFDDDDYDEFDRDGCDGASAADGAPIDFSAAFRIPNNSTTESVSR